MAFGSAPDVGGNISVGAMCAESCTMRIPKVKPNPNGAYPGAMSGGRTTFGVGGSWGNAGSGNGSEGSPGGPWPKAVCQKCPDCGTCDTSTTANDISPNSIGPTTF